MTRKSYYHDLKTDRIISEEEYHSRMERSLEGGLGYFGQYRDITEAQLALDSEYSFLKNNKYWNPVDVSKSDEQVLSMTIPEKTALIRKGLYLDVLINDKEESIRAAVAKTGFGVEKLVNDESKIVRQALARYEFELEKLVDDPAWEVRAMVAMRGFGLDKLKNDSDEYVRNTALRSMEKFKSKNSEKVGEIKMNDFQRQIRQAEQIKKEYPEGTRIYLSYMNDPYAPVEPGTRGSVDFVDDAGQVHMHWDNGRTLALVPGEDSFRKLTAKELEEEKKRPSLKDKIEAAQSTIIGDTDSNNRDKDNNLEK